MVDGGIGAYMAMNGYIYMVNGCQDEYECERYKPSRNLWEIVPTYAHTT